MTYNSGNVTPKFIDDINRDFTIGEDGKLYRNGKVSGYFDKSTGYYKLKYKGRTWLLHRMLYLRAHGLLPEMVDHRDRDVHNNVLDNLRAADRSHNTINSVARSDNTSGYKGVTWHKNVGKWHSSVFKDGKRHYCGIYNNKEEAAMAYNLKAKELFGDFAVLNSI